MPGVDAIKATLDERFEALSSQLICEPIELEDKIIIPITKTGIGLCTDIARTGPHVSQEGLERCKAGGGVGIFPFAVVIVFKGISGPEGVKVVPLSPPGDSLSDIAHLFMEKLMAHREKRTDNMVD
ncbi:MAG: spore germination protein GerW family protein [Methanothrix sp.]|nr:spore germination protein GerW family protein [Methanothrix sp.]